MRVENDHLTWQQRPEGNFKMAALHLKKITGIAMIQALS